MPNWCSNVATFRHADKSQLERLKTALEEERLFSEFVPNPDGSNVDNVLAWGTKWDTGADCEDEIEFDEEDQVYTLSVSFDTAWSPPIEFYQRMEEMGWTITGYYFEPGMNFCGKWEDGDDDFHYIPATARDAEDYLPKDVEEVFDICQMLADREHEENDEIPDWEYNEDEHS